MTFLSRYAKATIPAGIALSNVAGGYVATGRLDRAILSGAVVGLISSVWVALVPNA